MVMNDYPPSQNSSTKMSVYTMSQDISIVDCNTPKFKVGDIVVTTHKTGFYSIGFRGVISKIDRIGDCLVNFNNMGNEYVEKGGVFWIDPNRLSPLNTLHPRNHTSSHNEVRGPKGYREGEYEREISLKKLNNHPTFNKTKELYAKALKVEVRKRGHSETSRIKARWGTELGIIEEFITKGKKLPENTDKALDRVCDELLKYTESAGEYTETTNSYIDINTMIDVMLHPAK